MYINDMGFIQLVLNKRLIKDKEVFKGMYIHHKSLGPLKVINVDYNKRYITAVINEEEKLFNFEGLRDFFTGVEVEEGLYKLISERIRFMGIDEKLFELKDKIINDRRLDISQHNVIINKSIKDFLKYLMQKNAFFNINKNYNHYYLLDYFKKKNRNNDNMSQNIISFKNNNNYAVEFFKDIAASSIKYFFAIEKINVDYILRPLGHEELEVDIILNNKPLDSLAIAISESIGAKYIPNLLYKTGIHAPLHKLGSLGARRMILDNVYGINNLILKDNPTFLIIDDVFTTGATFKCIASKILKIYPESNMYFYTLAKTASKLNNNFELNRYYETKFKSFNNDGKL